MMRKTRRYTNVPIPSQILQNRTLSALEAIVFYLKDTIGFTYHEIAELTNRNDRTIWTTYHNAKKKMEGNA